MKWLRTQISHTLATIVLVCYIGSMILGLTHMLEMASVDMSMNDCPFSQLQTILCFKSVSNQLQDFQKAMFSMFGYNLLKVIFFVASTALLSFYIVSTLQRFIIYAKRATQRKQTLISSLFSDGILNTKVF